MVTRLTTFTRAALLELRRPGESGLSGRGLLRFTQVAVTIAVVVANIVGAAVVVSLAMLVVPLPDIPDPAAARLLNGVTAAIYVGGAIPIGIVLGYGALRPVSRWLRGGRDPSPEEQKALLRAPLRLFAVTLTLWLGAAVLFGLLNTTYSGALALKVATTVTLTGVTTSAIAYLLAERLLRPAAARALLHGATDDLQVPGVASRVLLAWALGTGVPLLGCVVVGIQALSGTGTSTHELAIATLVFGATGLTAGLLAVTIAARATADPIEGVRRALRAVREGRYDVRVHAYDGTQVGQLQLGFNDMVAGLAERERIREAFGTYVDPEVAERILAEGTDLAGEEVEVTAMFLDVRDFTALAERETPAAVVATINRLFSIAVPLVREHGGHVDKFVGDGLLAVFGAPRRDERHADHALAAACAIATAVEDAFGDDLRIGIGLNSGSVIAGNVGGGGRLEFSVIGDPVNVAARVEAATRTTGDTVLIAASTRALLREEHGPLTERPRVALKGKAEPVSLYAIG